ncbi:MAG: RHS repeat-associated core domain-containing protein [Pseudomonadota bacterium]
MRLFFKEIEKSKYLVTSIFALIVFCFSLISSSYAREYVEYIHSDGFQNAVAATDAEGDVLWTAHYQPFGESLTTQWKSPNTEIGFSGHVYDKETELNDMGARFYDPVLGRFMSFDPVGFDPDSPMSFNRYAYANNNPYKYIDPNGESPIDLAFLAVDVARLSTALYSGNIPAINSAAGDVLLSSIGVISPVPGTGQVLKAGKVIKVANAADNSANGVKLVKQLQLESAKSAFDEKGLLTSQAIRQSREIFDSSRIKNLNIPKDLGKYSTQTFQSPSGNFQVHFYKNTKTNEVHYGHDYKVKFNSKAEN